MAKKILIVDDEPNILTILSKSLYEFCNFQGEIKTVDNGRDAIAEAARILYDLCFLDIKLPDMSGLDVMRAISEISGETIIIIMTASCLTAEMKKEIDQSASLLISKPFDLSQVRAFMNNTFQCKEFFRKNNS